MLTAEPATRDTRLALAGADAAGAGDGPGAAGHPGARAHVTGRRHRPWSVKSRPVPGVFPGLAALSPNSARHARSMSDGKRDAARARPESPLAPRRPAGRRFPWSASVAVAALLAGGGAAAMVASGYGDDASAPGQTRRRPVRHATGRAGLGDAARLGPRRGGPPAQPVPAAGRPAPAAAARHPRPDHLRVGQGAAHAGVRARHGRIGRRPAARGRDGGGRHDVDLAPGPQTPCCAVPGAR